jgi:hypothetical protein
MNTGTVPTGSVITSRVTNVRARKKESTTPRSLP